MARCPPAGRSSSASRPLWLTAMLFPPILRSTASRAEAQPHPPLLLLLLPRPLLHRRLAVPVPVRSSAIILRARQERFPQVPGRSAIQIARALAAPRWIGPWRTAEALRFEWMVTTDTVTTFFLACHFPLPVSDLIYTSATSYGTQLPCRQVMLPLRSCATPMMAAMIFA